MNHRIIDALMAGLAPVIRDYVVESVAKGLEALAARIKAVEERGPIRGEKGEPGAGGKDGAPGERGEKGEPGADGKDGAPGRDGVDGKDGDPGPQGERGEKGEPGLDGKDGAPGPQGERGEKGEPGIDGKDGAPGIDGRDGTPGRQGERGEKGEPGRDGRDASDLKVIDKMIADQLGDQMNFLLSNLKVSTPDDGRTLVFEATIGEVSIKHDVKTSLVLDCGVWRERPEGYAKGDGATWAGSFWIAQRDTSAKPGVNDSGWRLAVKRGNDGKEGKAGERGPQGAKGDRGEQGPRGYGG